MSIRFALPVAVALLAAGVAVVGTPAAEPDRVHRDGFARNSEVAWVRGDANVHSVEKANKIDDEHARNAGTAALIRIEANPAPGATSAEYVHYYYETPPAPVTADLAAGVYVKAFRGGVQLKARVVFPKEKDPANPNAPLTTLIPGDVYRDVQKWKQLTLGDVPTAVKNQLAPLTAKLGRAVDESGAYIDALVLNVFTGAGVSEVWVDDLSIGPVLPQPAGRGGKAALANRRKPPAVSFAGGEILIDMHDDDGERPFFMRAIRHTGVPLAVLDQARFNTVWFPTEVSDQVYEEAVRAKFFLVPTLPLPQTDWDPTRPRQADPAALEKDAELVARHFRKFLATDAVLMWDLGAGRTTDQVRRVARLAETVRTYDPRRPKAIDLWDGYGAYSNYVDAVGAHRWPLFTSLEMAGYKDWLTQRKALTGPGKLSWTWIQTHLPDWYLAQIHGDPACDTFPAPVGPHPEQLRLLVYLSLAAGYRGLGYWSDKFLSDATHGQDRLLEIALLNAEIELLEPILGSVPDSAAWVPTSHPNVFAAVLKGPKETLVLPVWLGGGTQFCPDFMAVNGLTVDVPGVPDGATAWQITAAGIDEVKDLKATNRGTRMVLPEFDTAAAVVLTTDVSARGRVVRWQENTRFKLARTAAYWARRQAWVQYEKAAATHKAILAAGGPCPPDVLDYFARAAGLIEEASKYTDNNQPDMAYVAARRALRPLRLVMREHWRQAVEKLDAPTASPFAVSFYSLPKHWELARQLAASRPAGNGLEHGGFELSEDAPKEGAAVSSLPGWIPRKQLLDNVSGIAAIVNTSSERVADPPIPPDPVRVGRYDRPGRPIPTSSSRKSVLPRPPLGRHCLRLFILANETDTPKALERSFVAVDSPAAEFAPGTWVRVSFWAKAPGGVYSSADGVVVYDTAGGEPLSVRLTYQAEWKQFHLYRQVPASGKIGVTFALTGLGEAFFDDVRIEPMIPGGAVAERPTVPGGALPPPLERRGDWTLPKPRPGEDDQRTLPFPRRFGKDGAEEPLPQPRPAPPPDKPKEKANALPNELPLPPVPTVPIGIKK
jgi:hypothetical protein